MKYPKIGLALSGGGYRAAAFHLGVLKKLKELNILDKIDIFSTVSGGSIIGAFYLLNKDNFDNFEKEFRMLLRYNIQSRLYFFVFIVSLFIIGLTYFTSYYFLSNNNYFFFYLSYMFLSAFILCFFLFFKIIPLNKLLNYIYNIKFFKNAKLSSLPDKPEIFINSSNLETGTILSFSKYIIKDSSYQYKKDKIIKGKTSNIDISFAVTASSAFSPLFQPLKFKKNYFYDSNDYKNFTPMLIDGGVYDNQGIHNLMKCNVFICSDCSKPYLVSYKYTNPYSLLKKTIDFLMRRIRNFQIQHYIFRECSPAENIAYFSIGWSFDNCIDGFVEAIIKNTNRKEKLIKIHNIPHDILNDKAELKKFIKSKINYEKIIPDKYKNNFDFKKFENIKTNLKPLKLEIQNELIEYASILAEIQIKLYCHDLIN